MRLGTLLLAGGSLAAPSAVLAGPLLELSTWFGGSGGDAASTLVVDASGSVYIAGYTSSSDLPVLSAAQPAPGGDSDCFVAKFAPGGALVYSTYLGGSGFDMCTDIAVDPSGRAYLTGITRSTDFPLVNALQPAYGGGGEDVFVATLAPDGSRLGYSTYLGGSSAEQGLGIAVDAGGSAYLTGWTLSDDFPIVRALQPVRLRHDGFVLKLSADGSTLVYSTFLGGTGGDEGHAIAVDATGSASVLGDTDSPDFPVRNSLQPFRGGLDPVCLCDAFVTRLAPDGSAMTFSTFLGGTNDEGTDGIAVDASGDLYVTGQTLSQDFPLRNPVQATIGGPRPTSDAYLTRINPFIPAIVFSTYLGGSGNDGGLSVALRGCGVVLAGVAGSTDFPLQDPFQGTRGGGLYEGFVAIVGELGSPLLFSSYLGGSSSDTAVGVGVDPLGLLWLTGSTQSADFPTANPRQPALLGTRDGYLSAVAQTPGIPGDAGNTLLLAQDHPAGTLGYRWTDLALATTYRIYAESVKSRLPSLLVGSAPAGNPGLTIPLPPGSLWYYRVAGAACAGEGPR